MPVEVGQTVGDYEILDTLGNGGMARVYRVRNTLSGRTEAMKVILADLDGNDEIRARFGAEIRTLARLPDHPNIAKLCTAFRWGAEQIMLMEFVEGHTLSDLAARQSIPLSDLLSYSSQTLCALAHAHENGIIHRDVKPSNIMVTPSGIVKLMDFGIAKSLDDHLKTQAGIAIGSVFYMSPEQVRGDTLDDRSDLYSMGLVLYELTTGQRAFDGQSTYAIFDAKLNSVPPSPISLNPELPADLSDAIMKALEKEPSQRFQSASEFRDCLEAIAHSHRLTPQMTAVVSAAYQRSLASQIPVTPSQPPPTYKIVLTTPPTDSQSSPTSTVPDPPPDTNTDSKRRLILSAAAITLALVLVAVILWFTKKDRSASVATQSIAPVTTAAPITTGELPKEVHLPSGDMVLVPGGQALLGEKRTPRTIKSFYIDETEVSLAAYREFCREKGKQPPAGSATLSPDLPVVNVSYYDAVEFAAWAGKRLPTGDEWESAARGQQGQAFPWGNTFEPAMANLRANGVGHLAPVSSFREGQSPVGALNMLGNAWEIVGTTCAPPPSDQFRQYRKEFAALTPPLSPDEAFYQIRGGSFRFAIPDNQLPALMWDSIPFPARGDQPDVGFRCAKDAH